MMSYIATQAVPVLSFKSRQDGDTESNAELQCNVHSMHTKPVRKLKKLELEIQGFFCAQTEIGWLQASRWDHTVWSTTKIDGKSVK